MAVDLFSIQNTHTCIHAGMWMTYGFILNCGEPTQKRLLASNSKFKD